MTELFPLSDKTGSIETKGPFTDIVAYDHRGERFCVECATEHDEIDKEQWHNDPYSVPYGGSVPRRSIRDADIRYHCGNPNCGKKIPW